MKWKAANVNSKWFRPHFQHLFVWSPITLFGIALCAPLALRLPRHSPRAAPLYQLWFGVESGHSTVLKYVLPSVFNCKMFVCIPTECTILFITLATAKQNLTFQRLLWFIVTFRLLFHIFQFPLQPSEFFGGLVVFFFFVLVSFWVILLSVCTYCECQKITNTKIVSSACMNKLFAPHSVRRNLPHYSDADFKCTQSHACTCVGISGTTCHRRPSCPQPCRCLTEAVWVVFLYFLRITFPSSSFDTPRPA